MTKRLELFPATDGVSGTGRWTMDAAAGTVLARDAECVLVWPPPLQLVPRQEHLIPTAVASNYAEALGGSMM